MLALCFYFEVLFLCNRPASYTPGLINTFNYTPDTIISGCVSSMWAHNICLRSSFGHNLADSIFLLEFRESYACKFFFVLCFMPCRSADFSNVGFSKHVCIDRLFSVIHVIWLCLPVTLCLMLFFLLISVLQCSCGIKHLMQERFPHFIGELFSYPPIWILSYSGRAE